MKKFYFLRILVLVVLFAFYSCRKGSNIDDTDMSHVILNNTGEVISNDVFKILLYSMLSAEDSIFNPNNSLNFHYSEPCLQLSISPYDSVSWPKTITLAYPESGCYCFDGNIRGGQIVITVNGLLKTIGSVFKINLSNYSVNGIIVNGTKKITIMQIGSSKPLSFNDSNVFQINTSIGTIAWNSERFIEWVLGFSTESDIADDLFIVNGTSASDSFSGLITEAIQFQNYCFWIGRGKIEITPSGLSKRQITYSDSCLNQANVLINNETYPVSF